MSNINLLPDDLKKKEEKELLKLSKRPKKNEVEWNNPSINGQANLYSDVPKESFWASIFGTRNKAIAPKQQPSVRMEPQAVSPAIKEVKPKTQDSYSVVPKISKIENKNNFSFSNLFGPAASPIKTPSSDSEPYSKHKLSATKELPSIPKRREKEGLSFWQKLFRPKEKKHINWVAPEHFSMVASGNNSQKKYSADFSKMSQTPFSEDKNKNQVKWDQSMDFSKVKNTTPERVKSVKNKKGDGWFDVFKSFFVSRPKNSSWKMAGDDAIRDRLIKESLNLSKDKTWENYSKISKNQPNHAHDPKGVALQKTTPNHKDKERKVKADKSQQGKYHLAPKKESSGININLIPEELISVRKPNLARQVIALLLVIIFSGLVVGGLYFFIDLKQSKLNEKIATEKVKLDQLNSELSQYRKAQIENYDNVKKILTIDSVLRNHVYWTKFFTLLEKNTLDSSYYSGFSASVSGKFSLPVTTKNYASALSQVAAFNAAKDFAKDVSVDSMHVVTSDKKGAYGIGFDLRINLADGVFKK